MAGACEQVHGDAHAAAQVHDQARATATDVSGEVKLRYGRIVAARMFRIERAESDPTLAETTWVTIGQVSRQRFTVSGLTPYNTI